MITHVQFRPLSVSVSLYLLPDKGMTVSEIFLEQSAGNKSYKEDTFFINGQKGGYTCVYTFKKLRRVSKHFYYDRRGQKRAVISLLHVHMVSGSLERYSRCVTNRVECMRL